MVKNNLSVVITFKYEIINSLLSYSKYNLSIQQGDFYLVTLPAGSRTFEVNIHISSHSH